MFRHDYLSRPHFEHREEADCFQKLSLLEDRYALDEEVHGEICTIIVRWLSGDAGVRNGLQFFPEGHPATEEVDGVLKDFESRMNRAR